jgi:hypothetical protein
MFAEQGLKERSGLAERSRHDFTPPPNRLVKIDSKDRAAAITPRGGHPKKWIYAGGRGAASTKRRIISQELRNHSQDLRNALLRVFEKEP